MPYTKAALQAPGSGDLTNSPWVDWCCFQNTGLRTVAINLYISVYAQAPSIIFRTVLISKKPFAFTVMQVRKMSTELVPFLKKSDLVLWAKGCNLFEKFKKSEKIIPFGFTHKIRHATETVKELTRENSGQICHRVGARHRYSAVVLLNLHPLPTWWSPFTTSIFHLLDKKLSLLQLPH